MALSEKVKSGALTVLDSFKLEAYKTKAVALMFKAQGIAGKKILLVLAGPDAVTRTSARNIPRIEVRNANNLSVITLLNHPHLVTTREGIKAIETVFKG